MRKSLEKLPLDELRLRWAAAWGREPHARIGRTMLEKSLEYKTREQEGRGLTPEQQARLNQLIKQYKSNPKCFDGGCDTLKLGTRLIRNWKGARHSVLVKTDGFEYQGRIYTSLTHIANEITGSRWNGLLFFGLKS